MQKYGFFRTNVRSDFLCEQFSDISSISIELKKQISCVEVHIYLKKILHGIFCENIELSETTGIFINSEMTMILVNAFLMGMELSLMQLKENIWSNIKSNVLRKSTIEFDQIYSFDV